MPVFDWCPFSRQGLKNLNHVTFLYAIYVCMCPRDIALGLQRLFKRPRQFNPRQFNRAKASAEFGSAHGVCSKFGLGCGSLGGDA